MFYCVNNSTKESKLLNTTPKVIDRYGNYETNTPTVIFILIIIVICSCVSRNIRNNFAYKYDGKYTGIDTIISVDGYYHVINKGDYRDNYFLFYRDGTYASFFVDLDSNTIQKDKLIHKRIISGWGSYKICRDTIRTQIIKIWGDLNWTKLAFNNDEVDVFERSFLILSKDTIIEYDYNCATNENYSDWEYLPIKIGFTKMLNRPDSNCWLKKYSWAWKNVR